LPGRTRTRKSDALLIPVGPPRLGRSGFALGKSGAPFNELSSHYTPQHAQVATSSFDSATCFASHSHGITVGLKNEDPKKHAQVAPQLLGPLSRRGRRAGCTFASRGPVPTRLIRRSF